MAASRFMATWSEAPQHHFFLQAWLSSRMGLGRIHWYRRLDNQPTVGRKLICSLVKNQVQDGWMSRVLMSQTATGKPDIRSCKERLSPTSSARQSFRGVRADGLTRHPLNTQPKILTKRKKKKNEKNVISLKEGRVSKWAWFFSVCTSGVSLHFHVIVSFLLFVLSCRVSGYLDQSLWPAIIISWQIIAIMKLSVENNFCVSLMIFMQCMNLHICFVLFDGKGLVYADNIIELWSFHMVSLIVFYSELGQKLFLIQSV